MKLEVAEFEIIKNDETWGLVLLTEARRRPSVL